MVAVASAAESTTDGVARATGAADQLVSMSAQLRAVVAGYRI